MGKVSTLHRKKDGGMKLSYRILGSVQHISEDIPFITPASRGTFVQPDTKEIYFSGKSLMYREEMLGLYRTISNREKQVLKLVAEALDNEEIAENLSLSIQTVKNYVHIIYSKLDIHTRVRAMKLVNDIPEIRADLDNL